MNWDRIEGNWKQFKHNVGHQWGELRDGQIGVVNGRRDHVTSKMPESYRVWKEEAERRLRYWESSLD